MPLVPTTPGSTAPAPTSPYPTITPASLSGSTTPVSIPPPTPPSAAPALQGAIDSTNDSFTQSLANNAASAKTNTDNSLQALIDGLNKTGGTAEYTNDAYAKDGVNDAQAGLTETNNQITAEKNALNHQVDALKANPGGFVGDALQKEIDRVTSASLSKQADLSVIQLAKQGQFDSAKAIADRAVAAKMEADTNRNKTLQAIYDDNKSTFTTAEQQQFESAQADRTNALQVKAHEEETRYDQMIKDNSASTSTTTTTDANGNPISIPTSVAPYFNTSHSGIGYADLSTVQGTATQKAAAVAAAQASGIKVITNKNTALDLTNIQDANSKLDSINAILTGIDQPGVLSRTLNGLGLTQLAVLTQSNPQQAASGAINEVGLDILKAISGVQGFRGNQGAIEQVKENLPTIYDTQDTVAQKLKNVSAFLDDREDAILGPSGGSQSATPANTTLMTGPDGKQYNVPNEQVDAFTKAGGHQ